MTKISRWRFYITPQTHLRVTSNEGWMLAREMTDKYLLEYGRKKYIQRIAKGVKNPGSPNAYYNRKKTILRYWEYKRIFKRLADLEVFDMPQSGAWLKFFFPMPVSWSKKKRKEKNFTLHTSRPDVDNCTKAAFDSLMLEDSGIWDYRASKFWYDGKKGFIEITVGELPPANGYTKYVREDKIK